MAAEGSLDPLFTNYPPLTFYVFALVERLAGHLSGPITTDPSNAYLSGRAVSVAAFVAAVAMVWVACRIRYGVLAGILGACLVAVSPLAVRQAHFATTDMLQTALVTASLLMVCLPRSRRTLLVGAGFAGLAAVTKYTGGLVLVAVVMAWALEFGWRSCWRPVLVAALVFALPFAPVLGQIPGYLHGLGTLGYNAASEGKSLPLGFIFNATVSLPFGLGLGGFALAIAGIVAAVLRRGATETALLSFVVTYYLVQGWGHEDFLRYMLPMVPALGLLAGALVRLVPAKLDILALAAGLLILLPGASVSIATDRLLGVEDTRILAANWLLANVPAGTSIESPYYGGPYYSQRQIQANLGNVSDPLAASFLQGRYTSRYDINGPDPSYLVLASGPPQQAPLPATTLPIVFKISAGREGGIYDPLDAFYLPIWDLAAIERPGPSIVIVRLP
jgi:4-amino-4-deoxy-L-arabinose transferase-like glycosyltransferase